LFSGGLSAPHALQTTSGFLWRGVFFFKLIFMGGILIILDFFTIQKMNISEKMIRRMAMIMEMTTGLENIVN